MSLFVRSLLWTVMCPGTVTLLLPRYFLSGYDMGASAWGWRQGAGIAVIVPGAGILFWCIYAFARQGQGTLSPFDPARHLVVQGLYRYVRNPMYVGVITILLGESLFFGSTLLLGYTTIVFIAFNLFIRLHEEPYLRRKFGEEYERYYQQVGRWLPQRKKPTQ